MEKIQYQVIHTTRGRIRIRVPQLHHDSEYARILQRLVESWDFVTDVRINRAASSIIVNYQVSKAKSAVVLENLAGAIPQAFAGELFRPSTSLGVRENAIAKPNEKPSHSSHSHKKEEETRLKVEETAGEITGEAFGEAVGGVVGEVIGGVLLGPGGMIIGEEIGAVLGEVIGEELGKKVVDEIEQGDAQSERSDAQEPELLSQLEEGGFEKAGETVGEAVGEFIGGMLMGEAGSLIGKEIGAVIGEVTGGELGKDIVEEIEPVDQQ